MEFKQTDGIELGKIVCGCKVVDDFSDLASMDKEGKLTVHGRAKNVINRGGEAIYAKELENFLHDHPAISDVHVIPVCDKRLGEEICAWVELKQGHENTTAESIVSFCKGQVTTLINYVIV